MRMHKKKLAQFRDDFTKTRFFNCNCCTNSAPTRGGAEAVMLSTGAFVSARKSPRIERLAKILSPINCQNLY